MRVLFPEDGFYPRETCQSPWEEWGHPVVGVSEGPEAWKALQMDPAPSLGIRVSTTPGITRPER
jgi:hypothetical protein